MTLFRSLPARLVLGLSFLMPILPLVTGCSGGWGAAKPTVSAVAGKATTAGQTETLTVTATGTGPFTYQWYRNGVPVQGATGSTLSMTATSSDDGAVYTVAVTNVAGTVMSDPYVLKVGVGPTITTQPATQTVNAGQSATFTVIATGSATLNYQWFENGAAIAGATASTFTTAPLSVSDAGANFTVTVTNAVGKATSTQAAVSVNALAPVLAFTPVGGKTYGDAAFPVNASSASAANVTYVVLSGPASLSGSVVTITGVGQVSLGATQQANGNFTGATATTSFTVAKANPSISLASVANQNYGATVTASATSTSPSPITYAVASGPATISGNAVTTTGTGTVVIAASQPEAANYLAATATTSFTVGQATPTLTFAPVAAHTYGDPAFAVSASSTSDGAVTYAVVSGPATVSGNSVHVNGAGTIVLSASQAASQDYAAANATTSFTVAQATPSLMLPVIQAHSYGDAPFALNVSSPSTGAITYTVVSGPATIKGNVVTITGTGPVVLGISQAADADYAAINETSSFTVNAATPTLSFAAIAAHNFGDAAFTINAGSASSAPVSYSVISGPATVSGNVVTLTGSGPVVLGASQMADGGYTAANTTVTLNVGQDVPSLTFAVVPTHTYGDASFAIAASSASLGTVSYAVASGPATLSGNTVTVNGTGTVVLTASQAADGNYAAANATTSFTVTPSTPTLKLNAISNQVFGATVVPLANSASPGQISYSVTSGPATVSGNTVVTTGVGTVTVLASQAATANYTAATVSTTFTVGQATPTLTFAPVPAHVYGDASFAITATSASSGPVTYSVTSGPATVTGNLLTITGAGPVVIAASQASDANYVAATATTSFTVSAATPNLNLAAINDQVFGAAVTASASSNSPGLITYSVTPSALASISGAVITTTDVGVVTVKASQAATANYAAATKTTTFNVVPANTALTFANIPAHTYGDAAFTVSAVSASTAPVSYAVLSGPATISGNTLTITGAGTVTLSASQAATSRYTAATANTQFTVAPNVTITAISPAGQTIAPQQVTFNATATGGSSNTLTWSATGGSFNGTVWTAPSTAGTYTITATSVDEPSVAVSTTINVSKPVITTQPVSKNACAGYSPTLAIAAKYATSYQWTYNGSTLANTTNLITFNNASTSTSGIYTCTAINDAGGTTSNAVTLNVVTPTTLTISSQPASVSVYASQTATFAVAATGTGTLQYQWYKGAVGSGTAIAGATSRSYTTGALAAADSGSMFYVAVTDPDCTNTTLVSAAGTLTVSSTDTAVPPTIVTQPRAKTATVGGTAQYTVTASGSGTLNYQWYRVAYTSTQLTQPTAGVLISGATSSTYTVPASATTQSNDGDNYYVVVTNAYGSAMSNRVGLSVGAGISLQITGQPQTSYIAANTLASFSVAATCTGCTPAYQWYWYAPGLNSAVALSNGTVSTGALTGATVSGATTSSITLQQVPTTATGGILYVVVTSTSDGNSQIAGTNPLTSSTAGLFVGSLGSVGNVGSGQGLCNSSFSNWVLNGNSPGTASTTNVPYQNLGACTIEMTNGNTGEQAAVYWPTLISTANFSMSFTVQISSSGTPADGFTMVLADPSQGATTKTIGAVGEGLGANGIPGFVLGFDTYQNGNANGSTSCYWASGIPCDPVTVPYMAVGQGAASLWENPWTFVNGALDTQHSTNYSATTFANSTHSYVVSVVNRVMTVTMDGYELFTGTVSLPPAAYLGFTASTGGSVETVIFSNLTATVSAP